VTFWKHWVVTPSLALSGASLGLGLWGALDWAPALAAACAGALVAKVGARRVRANRRHDEAQASLLEFAAAHRRSTPGSGFDRAA
jgi:hypothetical protein